MLPANLVPNAFAQGKPKGERPIELDANKLAPLGSEKEKGRKVEPVEGDFWPLPPTESPVADTSAEIAVPTDAATTTTSVVSPERLSQVDKSRRAPESPSAGRRLSSGSTAEGPGSKSSGDGRGSAGSASRAAYSPVAASGRAGKATGQGRAAALSDSSERDGREGSPQSRGAGDPVKPKAGFDPKASKETRRDKALVVYDNPDGSATAVVYGSDVSVSDENGNLAPIDTDLAVDANSGRIRPERAKVGAEFAPVASDSELVSISDKGVRLSMALVGANAASGEVDGDTVTYPGALDGIDVIEQVLAGGVKETIVVREITPALGPDEIVGRITFITSGAALERLSDGSVSVVGSAGRVGTLPAPTAATADGAPIESRGLSYEVAKDATTGVTTLSVVIDRAWLSTQTLPLRIDPTYNSFPSPAYDTFVQEGTMANSTFGGSDSLRTGAWCEGWYYTVNCVEHAASFWRPADVSAFAGSYVTQACARFRLLDYAYPPEDGGPHIALAASPWDASTLTWNTGLGFLSPSVSELIVADPGTGTCQRPSPDWIVFDVTNMVRALAAGAVPNYGFRLSDESYYLRSSGYDSTDASLFDWPQLQVDYVLPPAPAQLVSPADESVIVDETPTLTTGGAFSDPDTPLADLWVWYRVSASSDCSAGNYVASSGWLPAAQNPSWTVPSGALTDGVTYTWCALTWDGSTVVAPNKSYSFRYARRLGASQPSPYQQVGPVTVNAATGNLVIAGGTRQIPTVGGNLGVNLTYNSQGEERGLRGVYTGESGAFERLTNVDFDFGLFEANGPDKTSCFSARTAAWRGYITVPEPGQWQLGILVTGSPVTLSNGTLQLGGSVQGSSPSVGTIYWGPSDQLTAGQAAAIGGSLSTFGGSSCDQAVTLLIRQGTGAAATLPLDWLSPGLENTPPRWNLAPEAAGTGFIRSLRTGDTVTLYDSGGAAHSYSKRRVVYPAIVDGDGNLQCSLAYSVYLGNNACQGPSSAYYPAAGETLRAVVIDGVGGELVATSEDGFTTTFNSAGNVQSASNGADDRNPAGHRFTYIPAPLWEGESAWVSWRL